MSTCKICGAQVKEGELYCGFCSAPVESENTYQQPQNYGRPSQSKIRVSAGEEYYDQFRNQTQSRPRVQTNTQNDYYDQYGDQKQSQPRVQTSSQDDYCNQYDYGTQSQPKVQSYAQNDYYNQYGNQTQQDNGMYGYNTNSTAKPVKSGKGKSLKNTTSIMNALFFLFSFISSGVGLAFSILGVIFPYWLSSTWQPIFSMKYNSDYCIYYGDVAPDIESEFTFIFSIIGICIFSLMILISIAGTIMNLVNASKNNK